MTPVSEIENTVGGYRDPTRILAITRDLFVLVDRHDRIRWFSPNWRQHFTDPHRFLSKSIAELIHPEDAASLLATLDDVRRRDDTRSVVVRWRDQGAWHPIRFSVALGAHRAIYCSGRKIESVEEEENRLRATIDLRNRAQELAEVGCWRLDLRTQEVLWSDGIFRIHGRDPATYRPTLEEGINAYHPEDRAVVTEHVQEAVATKSGFEFELRLLRTDGEIRNVLSRGQTEVEDDEVVGLWGIFEDITDRKLTEDRISEAQRELFATNDFLSGIISATDERILALDSNFDVLTFNKPYADMLETIIHRRVEIGDNLLELIGHLPEQKKAAEENFQRVLQGESFTISRRYPTRNGGELTLELSYSPIRDDAGSIMGISIMARDVSGWLGMQRSLRDSEARFRALIESSLQGVVIHRNYKPLFANSTYANIIGYETPAEVLQLPSLLPFIPEALREEHLKVHQELLSGERKTYSARFEETRRDGTTRWVDVMVRGVDWDGEPAVQVTLIDVSEQLQYQGELEAERAHYQAQAISDPLTGLSNRRHFFAEGARELGRAARHGSPVSLLLFDIDHFKRINDGYGHAAGDDALRQVPAVLGTVLRAADVAGRLGGEEFAVLLPETTREQAVDVAERIRREFASIEVTSDSQTFGFTVSLGVVGRDAKSEDLDELLRRADEALYEAKRTGRNRVVQAGAA
ncbi:MAG: hypothetical protein CMM50_05360 [Rhodospirillaceae bacterium]|nr:hypothetical protein [Rhodospirillaceae bacterium]